MEARTWYISLAVSLGLWCVWLECHVDADYQVTIATIKEGKLYGKIMKTLNGSKFVGFKGIPYAKPPVNELRFKPPQPPDPWPLMRSAREEGPVCPQLICMTDEYAGEEDCLYLNVYMRPGNVNAPVVVWVHGGAFLFGDGGEYDSGPQYLMDTSIVLVTFNYRLGALGFLSTGDSVLPGNYGLKDQVEVLRWVQRNIASFGGDPNRVTLLGYSSGGASVSHHLLSPLSTGLFHRAIIQSGSALNGWSYEEFPKDVITTVAELVDCPTNSSEMIVDCLKQVPAECLVRLLYKFPYWAVKYPLPYAPTAENQDYPSDDPPFLPGKPEDLIKAGSINSVPVIIGTAANEQMRLAFIVNHDHLLSDLSENFEQIMKVVFKLKNLSSVELNIIKHYYLSTGSLEDVTPADLESLFSDASFVYGVYRFARLFSEVSYQPVYYYLFTFEGRVSEIVSFGVYPEPYGVCHTDDLRYVLRRKYLPFPENTPDVNERCTIQRMMSFVANFAARGNPTPETNDIVPVLWEPLGCSCFMYLEIGRDLVMVDDLVFPERMLFWDYLIDHPSIEIATEESNNETTIELKVDE